VRAKPKRPPVSCELAHGMDLTLESTEHEIQQVRSLLRGAIEGLIAEFGRSATRDAVVALQFQDRSDQLLASAGRRIELVRVALGKGRSVPLAAFPTATPPETGTAEFF